MGCAALLGEALAVSSDSFQEIFSPVTVSSTSFLPLPFYKFSLDKAV